MNLHRFKIVKTQDYDCLSCIKCGTGSWAKIEDLIKYSTWNDRGLEFDFVVNNFYNSLNKNSFPQTTSKDFHEVSNKFPPIAHNNNIYLVDNKSKFAGTIVNILVCDFSEDDWFVRDIIK